MKALVAFVLVIAGLAAAPAFATCSYPKAPSNIPDGATATLEQMVAAQKAVKAYNDEIKAYTDCLKLEHDTAVAKDSDKLTKEQKDEMEKMQVQKNNAAVDEAEQVTARFNEQVKAYKAKSDKDKEKKS
jgi:hypothetical protein